MDYTGYYNPFIDYKGIRNKAGEIIINAPTQSKIPTGQIQKFETLRK